MIINPYIKKAIKLFGSQKKLAIKIGANQSTISRMLQMSNKKPLSAEWAIKIEKATNGRVRREQLSPHIFEQIVPTINYYKKTIL